MENKRKILLISDNFENYTTYLLKILAVKIMKANSCELIEINKSLLKSYENYRLINGCSQGLLKKEMVLMQSLMSYACVLDMLDKNPFDNYKFRKELKDYEPKTRFLTPAEARLLIDNSNELLAIQLIFLFLVSIFNYVFSTIRTNL